MKRKRESVNDSVFLYDPMMRPMDIGLSEYIIYVLWRSEQRSNSDGLTLDQIVEHVSELRIRWSQSKRGFEKGHVIFCLFDLVKENNVRPVFSMEEKSFNRFKITEIANRVICKAVFERYEGANYADRRLRAMFICDLTKTLHQ